MALGKTRGRVSENTDPCPGALSTAIRPPSSSASFFDSGRPRPVPLTLDWIGAGHLAEFLEDQLYIFRGDADPGIAHRKRHGIVLGVRGRPDADLALRA